MALTEGFPDTSSQRDSRIFRYDEPCGLPLRNRLRVFRDKPTPCCHTPRKSQNYGRVQAPGGTKGRKSLTYHGKYVRGSRVHVDCSAVWKTDGVTLKCSRSRVLKGVFAYWLRLGGSIAPKKSPRDVLRLKRGGTEIRR